MMDYIQAIGQSIQKMFLFLESYHLVYLFMDNAGGHRKTEVKSEYEQILKGEFKMAGTKLP